MSYGLYLSRQVVYIAAALPTLQTITHKTVPLTCTMPTICLQHANIFVSEQYHQPHFIQDLGKLLPVQEFASD